MDLRQMEAQRQRQRQGMPEQHLPASEPKPRLGLSSHLLLGLSSSIDTPRRGLQWEDQGVGPRGQAYTATALADGGHLRSSMSTADRLLGDLGRVSTMGPPQSRSRQDLPARPLSAASSGHSGMTVQQQQSVAALLASLQATASKGQERLQRLERVLGTIAGDAADSSQVQQAYSNLASLKRELSNLQLANTEFSRQLDRMGSRGELAEMRRRLEAHQVIMSRWEQALAQQLELVSALQSPSRRKSMLQQFSSAIKQRA